jgi:hypothetical protein
MVKKQVAVILLVLIVLLAVAPGLALADDHDTIPPFVVALPSHATLKIAVNGHCLNFGLPFPGKSLNPVEDAEDEIRLAIAYGLVQGYYTEENLEQVQRAIWHFTDGLDISGDEDALAREIVEFAEGAEVADLTGEVNSFSDAVEQGWIKVSLTDFENQTDPAYFGKGTLVVENRTDTSIAINIPYGVVFHDPQGGVQDMAVFPTSLPPTDPDEVNLAARETVCHPMSVKLPAEISIDVLVHGYCMDYGAPFPGEVLRIIDLAPEVIRNTVCYNIAMGYVQEDIWQAQLAIWRQTDALDKGSEFPLVDEVAAYAESGVLPGDIGEDCVPLPEAVEEGLVSANIDDFENITDPEYFGKGTMVLANLTDEEVILCLPYASAYKDEEQTDVQDMAVYPDQDPDPKDLEEPELLPESGGLERAQLILAIVLPAAVVLGSGFEFWMRRRRGRGSL